MQKCSSKSNEFLQNQLEDYVLYEDVVDEQIAAIASLLNAQDAGLSSEEKEFAGGSKSSEFSQKQLKDYVLSEEVVDEKIVAIASLLDLQDAGWPSKKKKIARGSGSLQVPSVSSHCERDQTVRSGF